MRQRSPQPRQEAVELGQIRLPQGPRLDQHVGQLLQAAEEHHLLEGKIDLGRVEHVHQDHLVPAVAEVLQAGHHRVHVVEQVAEDDHDAALFEPLGQVVEDRPGGRLPLAAATAP